MMNLRFCILGVILLSGCFFVKAADTLAVGTKIIEMNDLSYHFRQQVYANSVMRFGWLPFSFTSVRIGGVYESRGSAAISQEGNGRKLAEADVNSFVVLSPSSRLFGFASYQNGKRTNVLWNENADFNLLYPYVTGDSIGGFMNEESYRFSGGYVRAFDKWRLATELKYRAMLAYRDKDPRPRNVVSDLELQLSASRLLGASYQLATSLSVRTYDQKSSISFLGDKGSTSVYQMLGLGMDYVRFAGNEFSSQYQGLGFGASVEFLPAAQHNEYDGFGLSVAGSYFHLSKKLDGISQEINALNHYKLSVETSWMKQTLRKGYGMKIEGLIHQRMGRETIFGEQTNGVYTKLHDVEQFKSPLVNLTMSGFYQTKITDQSVVGWLIMPYLGYGSFVPEYRSAGRKVEISAWNGGMQIQGVRKIDRFLLTAGLQTRYTSNLTNRQMLPGVNTQSSLGKTLMSNINYLTDDHFDMDLSLRGDYAWSTDYAFQLKIRWKYEKYQKNGKINLFELSLGVVF